MKIYRGLCDIEGSPMGVNWTGATSEKMWGIMVLYEKLDGLSCRGCIPHILYTHFRHLATATSTAKG